MGDNFKDSPCRDCAYSCIGFSNVYCEYIFIAGCRRPCEPGENCKVKKKRKRKRKNSLVFPVDESCDYSGLIDE